MVKIHSLSINHYRSIEKFHQIFSSDFICLIGRGDSGKSTVLEAISSVLSSNWNLPFFDNDFYNCDTKKPIVIEVTLRDIPLDLMPEDKFGLYLRGIDADNKITDDIDEAKEEVLTIRLEVQSDLEPKWSVITEREVGSKPISANDRSKFRAFLVSDYLDRHFAWSKGSPLYSLLKEESPEEENDNTMLEALRGAKIKIDGGAFSKFDTVIKKVEKSSEAFGVDIKRTTTTIDFKDLVIIDGKVCLHDGPIPFRMKGKGSRRLISMAIQASIAEEGGIILIDEIEQGLEPDRVQSLVNTLKQNNTGQVFITTHSRDVLVELGAGDLFLLKNNASTLLGFNPSLQGMLRKNPEAFFAKKIVLCEGATEIGICRALNEFRIRNGKKNTAYLGVRFADGTGSEIVKYSTGLIESGLPVCMFCDSDSKDVNAKKEQLKQKGVEIFDWADSDNTERAILKDLPFTVLSDVFNLAAQLEFENDQTNDISTVKHNMWEAVKSRFGNDCPVDIATASDTPKLRTALGETAHSKGWFKRQDKSYKLGEIIFKHFDEIPPDSLLKKQLTGISDWIDR